MQLRQGDISMNFSIPFKRLYTALLFIGVISQNAQAGHPEEDPVMRSLQEQFRNGRTPTLDELRLGDTWVCTRYVVEATSPEKPADKYLFSALNGFVHTHPIEGQVTTSIKDFAFSDGTLSGLSAAGQHIGFLRRTEKALILESVALKTSQSSALSPAVSDATHELDGYVYCSLGSVKSAKTAGIKPIKAQVLDYKDKANTPKIPQKSVQSDPVFRTIQNRFKEGHTPTLDELRLGDIWGCSEYMLNYSADTELYGKFFFSELDGFIYTNPIQTILTTGVPKFAWSPEGLSGLHMNRKDIFHIRQTETGLIVEAATLKASENIGYDPSVSNPQKPVVAYFYCPMTAIKPVSRTALTPHLDPTPPQNRKKGGLFGWLKFSGGNSAYKQIGSNGVSPGDDESDDEAGH